MLSEVVTARVADAAHARSLRRDATAMVERLAVHARRDGLAHPVAAAVARVARISHLAGPEDFAARVGLTVHELDAAESGTVAFRDLPIALDPVIAALGLDLMSLADLEREWAQVADRQGHRC